MAKKKEEKKAFDKLIDKHKLFVENYVRNNGNGTRAYMDTYPNIKYDGARSKACHLLAKVNVKQAIQDKFAAIWKEKDSEYEKGKTFSQVKTLGESDITDIVDLDNGTLLVKDIKDIPSEARQWIQSIEYIEKPTKEGTEKNIKVKLHSKLQALNLRAKIQNMVTDKVEVSGDIEIIPAKRPSKKK